MCFLSLTGCNACHPHLPPTCDPVTLCIRDSTLVIENEGEAFGTTDGPTVAQGKCCFNVGFIVVKCKHIRTFCDFGATFGSVQPSLWSLGLAVKMVASCWSLSVYTVGKVLNS